TTTPSPSLLALFLRPGSRGIILACGEKTNRSAPICHTFPYLLTSAKGCGMRRPGSTDRAWRSTNHAPPLGQSAYDRTDRDGAAGASRRTGNRLRRWAAL